MTSFPINASEMLDENRYEEELKSAKSMAKSYVDALKARGNEDLASKYEHGHVHVECCATLSDIAAGCRVRITVHNELAHSNSTVDEKYALFVTLMCNCM